MNTNKWNAKEFAIPTDTAASTAANAPFDVKDESYRAYKPYRSPIDPQSYNRYNFHPSDLSRDVDAGLFFFISR